MISGDGLTLLSVRWKLSLLYCCTWVLYVYLITTCTGVPMKWCHSKTPQAPCHVIDLWTTSHSSILMTTMINHLMMTQRLIENSKSTFTFGSSLLHFWLEDGNVSMLQTRRCLWMRPSYCSKDDADSRITFQVSLISGVSKYRLLLNPSQDMFIIGTYVQVHKEWWNQQNSHSQDCYESV